MLRLAPGKLPPAVAGEPARHLPGRGRRAGSASRCCAAAPSRCSTRHQRRRHPPAHPPRRRGGAGGGRGLLRRARPSHGPHATIPMHRRSATSMPGRGRSTAGGLDAIIVTTSGCGTTVKDYGFMLRNDPAYAEKAKRVSALAKDISEYLETLDLGDAGDRQRACRRLSRRLFAAARPAGDDGAEGAARPRRLRGARGAGRAHLLRLGRHLQHAPAGDFRAPARPQGRRTSRRPAPASSLPATSAASPRSPAAATCRRPHRRASRLGLWRAKATRLPAS